jgi:hypothetical protein
MEYSNEKWDGEAVAKGSGSLLEGMRSSATFHASSSSSSIQVPFLFFLFPPFCFPCSPVPDLTQEHPHNCGCWLLDDFGALFSCRKGGRGLYI